MFVGRRPLRGVSVSRADQLHRVRSVCDRDRRGAARDDGADGWRDARECSQPSNLVRMQFYYDPYA